MELKVLLMISTKARYALRVLVDLIQQQNTEYVPLKDIRYLAQCLPVQAQHPIGEVYRTKNRHSFK